MPTVCSSVSSCKTSHHHLPVHDSFTQPLSLTHATHITYSPSIQDAASLAPSHPLDTVEHSGPFGPRWKMQNLQLSLFLHYQTRTSSFLFSYTIKPEPPAFSFLTLSNQNLQLSLFLHYQTRTSSFLFSYTIKQLTPNPIVL